MRALALLALLFASCAPVNEHAFDLQNIKPNCGRAIDVYTGYWFWERAFQSPHKLDAWVDKDGKQTVEVEQTSTGSMLSTVASVASTGMLLAPRTGEGCN